MKAMLKVSIITVCYNSSATIEETINSVINQSYKNIEYIVVDGKSTDNTLSIVKKFGDKISQYISEPDNGIYDAMNKGIALATGDIIGILNSDDVFYDLQVIKKMVDAFTTNPSLDSVYGNIVFFNEDIHKIVRVWKTKQYSKYYFEKGEVPPHPSLFVRAEVYKNAGVYKTNFKISSDQEFLLRILKVKKYKSLFLDEFIVRMRMGGVSTMGIKSYLISTKEIKKAWNSNGLTYPFWLYFVRPFKKIVQLLRK